MILTVTQNAMDVELIFGLIQSELFFLFSRWFRRKVPLKHKFFSFFGHHSANSFIISFRLSSLRLVSLHIVHIHAVPFSFHIYFVFDLFHFKLLQFFFVFLLFSIHCGSSLNFRWISTKTRYTWTVYCLRWGNL